MRDWYLNDTVIPLVTHLPMLLIHIYDIIIVSLMLIQRMQNQPCTFFVFVFLSPFFGGGGDIAPRKFEPYGRATSHLPLL